jgi:hypothetical protein
MSFPVNFTVKVSDKSTNFGLMEADKSTGTYKAYQCHRPKDLIAWAKKELFGTNPISDFLFGDFTVMVKGSDKALDPELSLTLAKAKDGKNGGHGLTEKDELVIKRETSLLNVAMSSSSSSLCCACIIFMFIMMNNPGDGF